MKTLRTLLLTAAAGLSFAALATSSASAAIVCSGDDCWHTHSVYQYPTSAHIVVHEDNWRWGDHDHFRWREHEGRGFWHGDSWEDF